MCKEENSSLQRGMNFHLNNSTSVILMSVRAGAPYQDSIQDEGQVLIYEGHDVPKKNGQDIDPKTVDQPMYTEYGSLTENGKFFNAAMKYKDCKTNPERVKVYEKIKSGIWVYNGYFHLVGAKPFHDGIRNVFKFQLDMIDDDLLNISEDKPLSSLKLEHNRLIPTPVKVAVYARDKGVCVKCGSNKNLHYDHIIPFSKGGSSTTVDNIQLLCAACNLKKHDNIE